MVVSGKRKEHSLDIIQEEDMKRVVFLVVALSLAVMVFAGGGQAEGGAQSVKSAIDPVAKPVDYFKSLGQKATVTWMTWSSERGVIGRQSQIHEVYPDLKEKVELKHVPGGANVREFIQKLRLLVMSGADVPDIAEGVSSTMPAMVTGNMIRDLTDVMQVYTKNVIPASIRVQSYNGRIMGFPGQVKTKLWFYRKDMMDAAGIDLGAIKNDDDFIAAGKKLKAKFPDAYLWFMGSPSESFFFEFMLSGYGGSLIDGSGKYSIVNNERVRHIFEFCKRAKDEGVVSTLSMFTPDFEAAIRDGKLATVMTGSWFKDQSYIPKYAPDQEGKWAVTVCPPVAGGLDRGSESGGSYFVIPNGAKNPDAGMAVMSLLAFDTDVGIGVFTKINAALEPLTDYGRKDPRYKQFPYYGDTLQKAIDQAMTKFDIVGYTPASMLEFGIVTQYFDMYLAGQGRLDDLLQRCENDLRTQIGNPMDFVN
jgi:ABC-type glycerol-3-phosphate transport system substrate-binding protein